MPQRYTLYTDKPGIGTTFKAEWEENFVYNAAYNVAPGSINPVIISPRPSVRLVSALRWGGISPTTPAINKEFNMINARREELNEKKNYKKIFQRQRCIIPANGFYEWQIIFKKEIPFYFRTLDQDLFGFAGIYERETAGDETGKIMNYAIITTEANALVKPLKDEMPAILERKHFDAWLDPLNSDIPQLDKMLAPYPSERMSTYRVGQNVNDPEKDGAELIHPVDA